MVKINKLFTNEQIEGLEYSIRYALNKQSVSEKDIQVTIQGFLSNDYNTINDVLLSASMEYLPLMTKYAKRFELSSGFYMSADEIVNATLAKIMTYDFETKWNEGKSQFMYNTNFLYTTLFGEVNNQARILYKDGKQGRPQKVVEIKSFESLSYNQNFQFDEQGTTLEYEYKEYSIKKVNASMGFLQMAFDNKEMMIDIKNLLSDTEYKAFKLYREGYKVREIASLVKDGRRAYDRMKKQLETYYAMYCYEMEQTVFVINE